MSKLGNIAGEILNGRKALQKTPGVQELVGALEKLKTGLGRVTQWSRRTMA